MASANTSPIKNRLLYTNKTSENIKETADPLTKTVRLLASPENNKHATRVKYNINNRMHVMKRLMDQFSCTGLINWTDLSTVCEWLEYPLCSFELNDAIKLLNFDKNGNVPVESVVEWFLNLEKLDMSKIIEDHNDVPPKRPNAMNGDPLQLQTYMNELKSSRAAMDGEIAHLELVQKISYQQIEELKEKLNQSFNKSYDLYDEIGKIDTILNKNEKNFGVIVGGTKGLTSVLKQFLD